MSYPSTTSARSPGASRVSYSLASMLALLTLSACSSNPPVAQPPVEAKQPPPPVLPKPQPVRTESVEWRVVQVDGESLFAVTARGYEALSRNLADTIRWAKEASWQLDFYRDSRQPADDPKGESK
ncbi:o-spanin [Stenotrophomonas phage DLP4]|nr:o-spanin [Stenotrophomonas phage DLP4]